MRRPLMAAVMSAAISVRLRRKESRQAAPRLIRGSVRLTDSRRGISRHSTRRDRLRHIIVRRSTGRRSAIHCREASRANKSSGHSAKPKVIGSGSNLHECGKFAREATADRRTHCRHTVGVSPRFDRLRTRPSLSSRESSAERRQPGIELGYPIDGALLGGQRPRFLGCGNRVGSASEVGVSRSQVGECQDVGRLLPDGHFEVRNRFREAVHIQQHGTQCGVIIGDVGRSRMASSKWWIAFSGCPRRAQVRPRLRCASPTSGRVGSIEIACSNCSTASR